MRRALVWIARLPSLCATAPPVEGFILAGRHGVRHRLYDRVAVAASIRNEAPVRGIDLPVLVDEDQQARAPLRLMHAAEVPALDADGWVARRGAIADRRSCACQHRAVQQRCPANALETVPAGRTQAIGAAPASDKGV